MTRYRTIVADPPWPYASAFGGSMTKGKQRATPMPYRTMALAEIGAMPVGELAEADAHLYLWTTQRFLRDAFAIAADWRFRTAAVLIWSKAPKGVVGDFVCSAEFILYCKRGQPRAKARHMGSVFQWPRTAHSAKPEAFFDLVEQVSPGPYAELFARRARFGWDYPIGDEALGGEAA